MPLIRRIPKRGFSNEAFRRRFAIINVGDLERFDPGTAIDESVLRSAKLIRGNVDGLKILANGELTKGLNITASKVSAKAKEKIETAGGSVTLK